MRLPKNNSDGSLTSMVHFVGQENSKFKLTLRRSKTKNGLYDLVVEFDDDTGYLIYEGVKTFDSIPKE